jgi:hypothetical protein
MRSLFGLILLLALTVASTSAISASPYRDAVAGVGAQQTAEPAESAEPSESPDAMEPGDPQGTPEPAESPDVDQTPTTPPTGAP